ncbi:MAG: RICIN domain-containing protein [Eggerthellaceae bacterium]|jgi:hypothetical protein
MSRRIYQRRPGATSIASCTKMFRHTESGTHAFVLALSTVVFATALILCATTFAFAGETATDTTAVPTSSTTTATTADATTDETSSSSAATDAVDTTADQQSSTAQAASSESTSSATDSTSAQTSQGAASDATLNTQTTTTEKTTADTSTSSSNTSTTKKATAPKVGSKLRPVADGAYTIVNRANRSYSISISRSSKKAGAKAIFQRFAATKTQTFILKYHADKKAYTIKVANSKKYLFASGKSGRVKQCATAKNLNAYWKIRNTRKGYALFNAQSGRFMRGKANPAKNGNIVVGSSKNNRSRWSLYAVKSCKKVSSSTRLNRIVDHIIRCKTSSHDSKATKFRKLFNYVASNHFSYAHVNNQVRPTYKGWSEKYALNMALKHHGNCFSYSSLFGYLARGCGYQTKIISGSLSFGSYRVKHGWVLCKVAGPCYKAKPKASKHGSWHIFDPESVHDYGIPFNLPYRGDSSTAVYCYSHPKLTE